MALVTEQPKLSFPIELAGRELLTLDWTVYFERPEDIVFRGSPGGPGPNLRVRAVQRHAERVVFTIAGGGAGELIAVVEVPDAREFDIVSAGGDGYPGTPGMDGTSGTSGSCPGGGGDGGNGTAGGSGSPGGPGGRGGDIRVEIACRAGDCAGLASLLPQIVSSRGGAGGRGGTGGSGGSGGSGTSCTDSSGRSTSGSSGSSGPNGSDGPSGAAGAPGHVELTNIR